MQSTKPLPNALSVLDEIHQKIKGKSVVLFIDYDGTLTPIVRRPELAALSDENRLLLVNLAKKYTVAIFSGRDLPKIRALVGVPEIYYAGSHGLEIGTLDTLIFENQQAERLIPQIDAVENELHHLLKRTEGVLIERKRFSVAIHYRMVAPEKRDSVHEMVVKIASAHPALRIRMGKMVYEIEPDIHWDKGIAVEWLLKKLDLDNSSAIPLYLGDDLTDEDAFKVIAATGIGIAIQEFPKPTFARYTLEGPVEVHEFLISLKQYQ